MEICAFYFRHLAIALSLSLSLSIPHSFTIFCVCVSVCRSFVAFNLEKKYSKKRDSCIQKRIKSYCSISGCVVQFPLFDRWKDAHAIRARTQDVWNINRLTSYTNAQLLRKPFPSKNTSNDIWIWRMASVPKIWALSIRGFGGYCFRSHERKKNNNSRTHAQIHRLVNR